jgi:SPP1 gp7 family putative phage head morphogenesis protein
MARVPLADMTKRAKPRAKEIVMRPVNVPATMASDLYASAYAPIIKAWEAAIPIIMEQYERSLAEVMQDSPADIGSILSGVENEAARIVLTIRLRLRDWAMRVERLHRSKWSATVATATGVQIGTMIGPEGAKVPVASAIERNVGLIRSISEQARTRIGQAIFDGIQRRQSAREVAKVLREAVGMGRKRALNVASDQMVKLASALNEERRREVGIDTFEWVHSGKAHPRPEHKARNGRRYSDDEAPDDMPGELPFCGCTSRAVLSLEGPF